MIPHGNAAFQSKEQSARMDPIPAGVYEGAILGAKVENQASGAVQLVIQLEITAGEYAGYFKRQFESQKGGSFSPKYKGIVRYRIPQYDSSGKPATDSDRYAHDALQHMAWALEQSNPEYSWDWDESKLKGKQIGFSVRERAWIMEDNAEERGYREGTTTEIMRLESLPAVREGKVKTPKKRGLSQRDIEKKEAWDARFGGEEPQPYSNAAFDEQLPF